MNDHSNHIGIRFWLILLILFILCCNSIVQAKTASEWIEEGRLLFQEGKYEEALSAFDNALSIDPNNEVAWLDKGATLISLGDYKEGLRVSIIARSIDPKDAMAWNNEGFSLYNLGRYPEALDAYNRALDINPDLNLAQQNKNNLLNVMGITQTTALPTVRTTVPRTQIPTLTGDTPNKGNSVSGAFYLLLLFILISIGYFIYRKQKQHSEDQPPIEPQPPESPQQPVPSAPSSGAGGSVSVEDLLNRIASVEQKASSLAHFKRMIQPLLTKAKDKYRKGEYDTVRTTLSTAEITITSMKQYETRLMQWRSEGYVTTALERRLQTENMTTIDSVFRDYEQDCASLKQSGQRIQDLKRSYGQGSTDPEISRRIVALESLLNDPQNVAGIEREIDAIQQAIRDQQEKEQRRNQAEQQLSTVNDMLIQLRSDGAVVSYPIGEIRQTIDEENYDEAITASEKAVVELTRIQEIYTQAKTLRSSAAEPEINALFDKGEYEGFIRAIGEWQERQIADNALKETASVLLEKARKFGQVSDTITAKVASNKISDIESAIQDLESFIESAKPNLVLTLDRIQMAAGEWHKVGIQIKNTGNAHAVDVNLSFSDDFETRWIEPIEIELGTSALITSGIFPKKKGNIPLEIRCSYKDKHNKEYQQKFRYWIDVVDRMSITPGTGAVTPSGSGPVSQFTPKPTTIRQLPPDLSDRYTDSEFIGKGGFARVFKAKRKDGKFVAVKIPLSMDALTGKSFIAEMQNWTKLSHPNIVSLYDFNIMPVPYFEEELCDNALAELKKPIECEEAFWILFNVCEGLKFAHALKIIHRDLKPQNILMKNGVPKISDWGLSRIISESTTTTSTSFTAYYAAPEQINNRPKDERTDIWQLGVILYELVTGELPFKGDSMVEIGMNISTKDPIRPGEITRSAKVIDAVVMKCLEKDPKNRYRSALDLQKDLAMFLGKNYAELLKTSVSIQDNTQSAYYCGDLVMINLLTGDISTAYKYLLDLVHYSKGDVKVEAQDLSEQIKMRMEMGVTEIPDELIQKAKIIVHQVSMGFKNKG